MLFLTQFLYLKKKTSYILLRSLHSTIYLSLCPLGAGNSSDRHVCDNPWSLKLDTGSPGGLQEEGIDKEEMKEKEGEKSILSPHEEAEYKATLAVVCLLLTCVHTSDYVQLCISHCLPINTLKRETFAWCLTDIFHIFGKKK